MGTENAKIKVLVTGGGGFVGMALVRRLVQSGYQVSSFSRNIYKEHKQMGVKSIQGDITDADALEMACEGVEAVFHVAAKVGIWGNKNDFYKVNVAGTEKVIRACRKKNVKKLIFTSSASVVFDGSDLLDVDEALAYPQKPVSFYTSTKAEAEQLVLAANSEVLRTISLRPHLIWGPGDTQLIPKIIRRVKSGRFRKIGREDVLIDTVYIDNLIDAQLLALEKMELEEVNGKAFFITNGKPIFVWSFINSITEVFGLFPVEKRVPKVLVWLLAWMLEQIHRLFHIEKEPYITRFVLQQLCTNHWFDISRAKRLLGYSPKVGFKEGIRNLKDSLNKNEVL
ncbi:NAD-dependent epimerase/dehydratase family protein [Prolixibacteraceae bacterium Z1-6]|uniref:NAD-dependent epimerase/dehydratase family protein n=1 Tax=Draconibacterium aestuarii TaxID=2998507 RepID=A0A9X3F2R2_9BACT|nr:NAD-dependent epimerase/dehydratase family protein [Prolixibacteraceae bacterium Z1-6]